MTQGSRARAANVELLSTYRSRRGASRGRERGGAAVRDTGARLSAFVVQEHRARSLHFDFRLEHDGMVVSWAVPKGLPLDGRKNRLAIRTADASLDRAEFEGTGPAGEYGGGSVRVWDRGSYECELWSDEEIKIVLHGARATGRYALVHTGERHWLVHHTAS